MFKKILTKIVFGCLQLAESVCDIIVMKNLTLFNC
jgi:hypothetical protein